MGKILLKNTGRIPEPTLRRLPWYLSTVKILQTEGEVYVSSTRIAKATGMEASQVAKDLSYVDLTGRTRIGYEITSMVATLESFLGFTHLHKAYLFGVGSLGGALLQDSGLKHFGLYIVGAFDINPAIVGTSINGIPIYHTDEYEKRMAIDQVNIGVLTVPISIAQEMTDKMVAGGIRGIWNFTPYRIHVPDTCMVQNTSLYASLAVMYNRLLHPEKENK
ncbi:MAG: redox-sensing transcriptional repressor Rex [Phocaeicola sp.]|nr:redox-sensing transcriptional repressor Rex [Phocaeicola sp.]MDD7448911.1 redox-sensing transcriptional repressor Rex [Prevotellaceae bacterium]MDY3914111.1 redox-sensing transcriptional repressor Rex [Phocaeicola sp.]MDY5940008.1 redox-sensing transcriptional repressor Rex [Phocaeicola sp.]